MQHARTIGVVRRLRDEDSLAVASQFHVFRIGGLKYLEVAQAFVVAVTLESMRRSKGRRLLVPPVGRGRQSGHVG